MPEVTSDHVFPESWYPDSTPLDLAKWQVPACLDCNRRSGRNEADLLLRMGLCVDPDDFKSLGISDKVQRSIDPSQGHNERDREHRRKRREMVLRQLLPAAAIPAESVFPGFEAVAGTPESDQVGITVSPASLEALVRKIVRGITLALSSVYIEDTHEILIFFRHEADAEMFREVLRRFGTEHHRGPGIIVTRAVPDEDPLGGSSRSRFGVGSGHGRQSGPMFNPPASSPLSS